VTRPLRWRGTARGRRASEPSAEELPDVTEPAVVAEQTIILARERQSKSLVEHPFSASSADASSRSAELLKTSTAGL
jgi:hypothetical protein